MSDDVLHYLFLRDTGCDPSAPDYDECFTAWFEDQVEAASV